MDCFRSLHDILRFDTFFLNFALYTVCEKSGFSTVFKICLVLNLYLVLVTCKKVSIVFFLFVCVRFFVGVV